MCMFSKKYGLIDIVFECHCVAAIIETLQDCLISVCISRHWKLAGAEASL